METYVLRPLGAQAGKVPLPKRGTKVVIGVDLSRTKWVFCCRWDDRDQRRLSTPAGLVHLQAIVREYAKRGCRIVVVYEACGFGYQIAWWCETEGHTVIVVAPSTIERAPGLQVKTDPIDAGALALKADKGLLKSNFVPRRPVHELRQLSRSYNQVLADRRRQQCRVRLLLQEHGIEAPSRTEGWSALETWLGEQELAVPLRICIAQLCALRQTADGAVKRLRAELLKAARRPEYTQLVDALSAQAGVGRLSAIRFILELGTMTRFPRSTSLTNFLGLTPYEYSSGAIVHRGTVRKCGPRAVRAALVQCAWAAIRSGADPALRDSFETIAERGGRKRAIVATARRLALRLRARWIAHEQQVCANAA